MKLIFFISWFLFYAGFATSLLLTAQTSVSSASNNLKNVWQWIDIHRYSIWANLFLSTAFSAVIFRLIPASSGLGDLGKYAVGGFIASAVLDKILFIFGQSIGTRIDVPQLSPPAKGEQ
jgi:hypothetical protein